MSVRKTYIYSYHNTIIYMYRGIYTQNVLPSIQ